MENYSKFKDILEISDYSRVRKHRQIVNSVLNATSLGSLKLNDKLPSVNELSIDYNISRDTVVRAYAFLKENDIIDSVPGKGYYIKSISDGYKAKVFLLFDTLSPQMKKIYDAFSETLKDIAVIDFYIYQNNYSQFKKQILYSNTKEYTHYVLATNFEEESDDYIDFIKKEVPLEKLILLNKGSEKLNNEVACVYQDFETEFILALEKLRNHLKKYKGFKLVSPKGGKIPNEIKKSFKKFCIENEFAFNVIEDFTNEVVERHMVYIVFEDDESLVSLIKKISNTGFVIGKEIGILSYDDDNPLKELLAGGITVLSRVFEKIGYQAADIILKKERKRVLDPLKVIVRKSL
ncbi:MAG: hypothetical protein RLZZ540_2822 [Bacteroidota bacterium]|jgi:DNA-binding transcriptional regulator YhcF (GntR family)